MKSVAQFSINSNIYSQAQLITWCNDTLLDRETEEWENDIADFIKHWFDAKQTTSVKSSGTTGTSKELVLSKKAMAASAKITNSYFNLDHQSNALLCIPVKYIGGKMMLVRMLVSGMNLWITKPSADPLEFVSNKAIDFCPMIPLQVEASIKSHPTEFKNIKNIIIGGAPISYELEKELYGLENNIYATFGMTETLSHVALRNISGENANDQYFALDGITFDINKDADHENCLIIRAPHLQAKPFITNDVVTLIDDKTFIWNGRKDNIINTGGIKFSPEELEKKLNSTFHDNSFFIAGLNDQRLGQKIVLFIESEKSIIVNDSLTEKLIQELPKYGMPKDIVCLPTFFKTETGKIKRKETINNWLDHTAKSNDSL